MYDLLVSDGDGGGDGNGDGDDECSPLLQMLHQFPSYHPEQVFPLW